MGEKADDIDTSAINLNSIEVDWRQLRRWGIDEARVPAGTVIRFREPTVWDRYRGYILAALALLMVQSGLIAGLLIQRARRRHAEHTMERGSEMTVARVPERHGNAQDVVGVTEKIERAPEPKLIAIAVDRLPGVPLEDATQMEYRRPDGPGKRGQIV